jgi:hypothetical protein
MSVAELLNSLHPECPAVTSALDQQVELLKQGETVKADLLIAEFANVHIKEQCPVCRNYEPPVREDRREEDNRSPTWGGATMGLVVGLIAGFFRDGYWQTVVYAVVIGAVFGFATDVFARVMNARYRRR